MIRAPNSARGGGDGSGSGSASGTTHSRYFSAPPAPSAAATASTAATAQQGQRQESHQPNQHSFTSTNMPTQSNTLPQQGQRFASSPASIPPQQHKYESPPRGTIAAALQQRQRQMQRDGPMQMQMHPHPHPHAQGTNANMEEWMPNSADRFPANAAAGVSPSHPPIQPSTFRRTAPPPGPSLHSTYIRNPVPPLPITTSMGLPVQPQHHPQTAFSTNMYSTHAVLSSHAAGTQTSSNADTEMSMTNANVGAQPVPFSQHSHAAQSSWSRSIQHVQATQSQQSGAARFTPLQPQHRPTVPIGGGNPQARMWQTQPSMHSSAMNQQQQQGRAAAFRQPTQPHRRLLQTRTQLASAALSRSTPSTPFARSAPISALPQFTAVPRTGFYFFQTKYGSFLSVSKESFPPRLVHLHADDSHALIPLIHITVGKQLRVLAIHAASGIGASGSNIPRVFEASLSVDGVELAFEGVDESTSATTARRASHRSDVGLRLSENPFQVQLVSFGLSKDGFHVIAFKLPNEKFMSAKADSSNITYGMSSLGTGEKFHLVPSNAAIAPTPANLDLHTDETLPDSYHGWSWQRPIWTFWPAFMRQQGTHAHATRHKQQDRDRYSPYLTVMLEFGRESFRTLTNMLLESEKYDPPARPTVRAHSLSSPSVESLWHMKVPLHRLNPASHFGVTHALVLQESHEWGDFACPKLRTDVHNKEFPADWRSEGILEQRKASVTELVLNGQQIHSEMEHSTSPPPFNVLRAMNADAEEERFEHEASQRMMLNMYEELDRAVSSQLDSILPIDSSLAVTIEPHTPPSASRSTHAAFMKYWKKALTAPALMSSNGRIVDDSHIAVRWFQPESMHILMQGTV